MLFEDGNRTRGPAGISTAVHRRADSCDVRDRFGWRHWPRGLRPEKAATRSEERRELNGRPNIVLTHGAFAGGSNWSAVIERLQAGGFQVRAPSFG
jgi:hypothetical protein